MSTLEQIKALLGRCSLDEKKQVFDLLRSELMIHPIERTLNVSAERILEALSRSSDLTRRGIRGIIAEATFVLDIVPTLYNWSEIPLADGLPYDCLLKDGLGEVRVQIKMQRLERHLPKMANRMKRFSSLPGHLFVVETQRTRGGTKNGEKTRPYRFGEFDILGVCLHPSTNSWSDVVYTVANWLIPSVDDHACIATYQPVSPVADQYWTNDFSDCVSRLRSGVEQRLFEREHARR